MYQALYRKYRPKVFADVIGQEHITSTLKNELVSGRLSHAYLFIGSRGTGKTTCAKILAKAVNCPGSVNGDPCGECEICRGIDDGSVTDIVEIDAASNNGVDNIRDLRDEVNFTPVKAKYRVYIIDEVHMLSAGAFNALLKTLEEPPEHVKFILATTEANKLPATILSRCQRFDFRRISAGDMSGRLKYVAESESATLTDEASLLIGRLADGAMRDALSILDQCISRTASVDEKVVCEVGAVADKSYLEAVARAIADKDSKTALEIIDTLYKNSVNMESFLNECITFFRNIMIVSSVKDSSGIIECDKEDRDTLIRLSGLFTLASVLYIIDALQQALIDIKSGANRRLECEMAFIRLTNPSMDKTEKSVLKRLSELERAVAAVNIGAPNVSAVSAVSQVESEKLPLRKAERSAEPVKSEAGNQSVEEPQPSAEIEAAEKPAKKLLSWPEVISELSREDKALAMMANGTTARLEGGKLIISGANRMFRDMIENDSNGAVQKIKNVVQRVCAESCVSVGFYSSEVKQGKDPLNDLKNLAISNGVEINIK